MRAAVFTQPGTIEIQNVPDTGGPRQHRHDRWRAAEGQFGGCR